MIRVLAVNHNRILAEGVRVLIDMEPGLEIVGCASDADSAVSLFCEQRPDLTLMDLDLPSQSGLQAIRRIRQIDPQAWIIGLITDEYDECRPQAIAAGASTLVPKDLIGTALVSTIHFGSLALKSGASKPATLGMGIVS